MTTPSLSHSTETHKKSLPTHLEVEGYKVRKLKLTEYAVLMDKLGSIPYIVSQIEGIDDKADAQAIFKVLPEIVKRAIPEVTEILAIVTGEKVEKLRDELDLLTAVRLIEASIEVNGFLEVFSSLKKLSQKAKS